MKTFAGYWDDFRAWLNWVFAEAKRRRPAGQPPPVAWPLTGPGGRWLAEELSRGVRRRANAKYVAAVLGAAASAAYLWDRYNSASRPAPSSPVVIVAPSPPPLPSAAAAPHPQPPPRDRSSQPQPPQPAVPPTPRPLPPAPVAPPLEKTIIAASGPAETRRPPRAPLVASRPPAPLTGAATATPLPAAPADGGPPQDLSRLELFSGPLTPPLDSVRAFITYSETIEAPTVSEPPRPLAELALPHDLTDAMRSSLAGRQVTLLVRVDTDGTASVLAESINAPGVSSFVVQRLMEIVRRQPWAPARSAIGEPLVATRRVRFEWR